MSQEGRAGTSARGEGGGTDRQASGDSVDRGKVHRNTAVIGAGGGLQAEQGSVMAPAKQGSGV